jgi:translation initiation factor IF-1
VSREAGIKIEGVVVEVLSERLYRVEFRNGHRLLAHLPRGAGCGFRGPDKRNTQQATRVFQVGDKVTLEMSPFDFSKGRIWLN